MLNPVMWAENHYDNTEDTYLRSNFVPMTNKMVDGITNDTLFSFEEAETIWNTLYDRKQIDVGLSRDLQLLNIFLNESEVMAWDMWCEQRNAEQRLTDGLTTEKALLFEFKTHIKTLCAMLLFTDGEK
jgi:hypothetical protein